ncbi:MAG: transcriptional activator RfaH [Rhodospirillales bacterium]|jgi:transcriptional antiterminator RfaH|nr:transcriptional activator RfaH [Rhodospirillales bacterium]
MLRWYVVHTKPRGEETALFHLRRQDFEAYLPCHLKKRVHARRTDWVPSPLFPNYMFVAMDKDHARWRSIRGTIGVKGLVCNGDQPLPVPEGIVEAIRAQENGNGYVDFHRDEVFNKGERVEIAKGPFAETCGIFECVDSKDRVIVLLSLLGREVRTRVRTDWVQAAA